MAASTCRAKDGATFDTINPATGQPIVEVAHCMAEDVDAAVRAPGRVPTPGRWPRRARGAQGSAAEARRARTRAQAEELAVLESIDSGKTINDCLHEIGNEVANFFQWYAELADKTFGKVAPTGEKALALIVKEPAGWSGWCCHGTSRC